MKKWNEVTAQEKAWFLDEAVNHGAIEITREEVPHKLQQDCFNYLLRGYYLTGTRKKNIGTWTRRNKNERRMARF